MAVPIARPSVPQRDLIERARAGAEDGIAGLYARHAAELYRLALRLTESEAEAEDVVHDVFVGLPEALRRYKERGSFESWLKRVTVRLTLMRMRTRRRRREVPLDTAPALPAAGNVSTAAETLDLHEAIARLPDAVSNFAAHGPESPATPTSHFITNAAGVTSVTAM